MERKRNVRKGETGNVSERERGMRMMWKKERKEVKGWDRTVGVKWWREKGESVRRMEKCGAEGRKVERKGGKCEVKGWKGGGRGEVGEVQEEVRKNS